MAKKKMKGTIPVPLCVCGHDRSVHFRNDEHYFCSLGDNCQEWEDALKEEEEKKEGE